MMNILWRLLLSLVFLISLLLILVFAWNIPNYLGYNVPEEFTKLPITICVIVALITGFWGTWSRGKPREKLVEKIVYRDTPPDVTTQT